MLPVIFTSLSAAAFAGAGVFNVISTPATRDSFVRWGYPAWWHRVTGALEVIVGALIAFPTTRFSGLLLGAIVIAAAVFTVIRFREWSHLAPLGAFFALLALTWSVG
ncbi:DoxX family protein [Bradyrhizobium sp. BR 10289]|uniref:DoxX family protein n=1 Tax=Bradyrhizobium sp. BR 10289 TaxID=2749993 RepID=UPI001C650E66|nr:DoxX family protein [Bradyrhizobium sp. BR 10289]MBW7970212.1 DoxX family protein [Bradyrhizobium sp. BR 10289]